MCELIPQVNYELLKFGVMLGSDVGKHEEKQTQRIKVLLQVVTPLDIVHIAQVNLGFLASDENAVVLFVEVQSSPRSQNRLPAHPANEYCRWP